VPHRIWRIETDGLKIELWPLGGLTREEDILRRDFTCNALSWELPDGPLVDLVGGVDDIGRRTLRAISQTNLEDDPVRLLRGPRFLAQLEAFELDPETRRWIRELAPRLGGAPRERVGHELLALLQGGAPTHGLRETLNMGVFEHAAPIGIDVDVRWLQRHVDAVNALSSRRIADNTARLAFLFRAWGSPEVSVLAPYAWPKADRDIALRAARLLDDAAATVDAPPTDRRELAWRAGPAFPSLIRLAAALAPDLPGWARWRRQWRRDPAALTHPRPLLTGDEISAITGIDPGPELGTVADALLRAQVRGEFRSRRGALRWLKGLSASR